MNGEPAWLAAATSMVDQADALIRELGDNYRRHVETGCTWPDVCPGMEVYRLVRDMDQGSLRAALCVAIMRMHSAQQEPNRQKGLT